MKIKEISTLKLEDYFWRVLFGKSKRRASFFELRANGFKDLPAPIFFLSTGRCGTNWFTLLLSNDRKIKAFHEPKPNFGIQGKLAYEFYTSKKFRLPPEEDKLWQEIFLTGREQYLRYSYKTERVYAETNNQASFLAPAIYQLFPQTRFVHLNRHPGEFVRSAMRRNFYNNPDDIKRIVPGEDDPHYNNWNDYSQLEKNSWLWQATNNFIEQFTSGIPPENHFYFDFSALNEENVEKLCGFLHADIDKKAIRKLLKHPVNVQQTGKLDHYQHWSEEEKAKLIRICGDMATKYQYKL